MSGFTSLVQDRWFQGQGSVSNEQQKILKALPIFELAGVHRAGAAPLQAQAGFMDLLEDRFLAPEGSNEALLGPGFITCTSAGEANVLTARLGVQQLTPQHFFTQHVLPR